MGIIRYNQSGVGQSVTFGRRGGKISWKDDHFHLQDADNNAAKLIIAEGSSEDTDSAATIGYVNKRLQGLRTKKSVDAVLEINRISDDANVTTVMEGTHTDIDGFTGVALTSTLRVLVRVLQDGQDYASEWNGIYTFNTTDSKLHVAEDASTFSQVEGAYVFVANGSRESTGWVLNVADDETQTDGTTAITPTSAHGEFLVEVKQFHGQGNVTAGTGLRVEGKQVQLALGNLSDETDTVSYDDNIITVTSAGTHQKLNFTKLTQDLGVESWKIAHGDNQISVATSRTTARDSIVFGVKQSGLYNANASILNISASGFVYNSSVAPSLGASGSNVSFTAGAGNAAEGGNVTFNAGKGNGADELGGNIVLVPGAGGTGTGQLQGVVQIDAQTALQLPYGTDSQAPTGAAGYIRISSDNITGTDTVMFYDTQSASWSKIAGSVNITDMDGDTRISVADTDAGDDDIIRMFVGDTSGAYVASEVMKLSGDGITLQVPEVSAANIATNNGGAVNIAAGKGQTGGNVTITSGVGESAKGGDVVVTAASRGAVTIATESTLGNNAGSIVIKAGSSNTGEAGNVSINAGASGDDTKHSSVNIGTSDTTNVVIGDNDGTSKVSIDASEISLGTNGAPAINIGKVEDTVDTIVQSTNITLAAGASGATTGEGVFKVQGDHIHIGSDTSSSEILIGNQTAYDTNVSIKANTLELSADAGITIKAAVSDTDVAIATSGSGVLHASSTTYTESVSDDNDIPNLAVVKNAFRDANFGGVGRRLASISAGDTGLSFTLDGGALPGNAIVTRIVVDIEEAFSASVTSLKLDAASGVTELVTNNDIDISTVGTYIIELPARQVSSGDVVALFNTALDAVNTGKVHFSLEFITR